ncbi:spore germination protein [Planifilum fimeticola]|uniref:Spore germination protein n=1 Tax=Planifilum fimeticola TaxID=201975 RepID=A0A2T0LDR7_9BACL|nr:germination protein YpeB [Planifilum fimeticola]PRX39999.1 spore germination protein [Planifilum fimeticola]
MFRRIAVILLPVALVGLVGTTVWGYQENQEKNALLIKAENQYQRAFHDLNFHVNKLQDELGKSLALGSRRQISQCLTNVWRLAYAAQSDLGQLPLSLVPFDKTEEFLAKIGQFSYQVGLRDLDREPLTDKEWNTLRSLYERSNQIQRDLQKLQSQVLEKNLRWMDVELALASEDKKMDNTIIDGFRRVDQLVNEYPEVDWGPTVNNMGMDRLQDHRKLKGKKITPEEAKKRLARMLDRPDTRGIEEVASGTKGDESTYSLRLKRGEHTVYADVTKVGGHVLWMMFDRPIGKKKMSLEQAEGRAEAFLDRLRYPFMEVVSYDEKDNAATFNLVRREGKVRIYPETVTVKVALDNGEVLAFSADEYVFNHRDRKIPKPKLSGEEARKRLSRRLRVQDQRLALIRNDQGKEVLCYEFLGMLGKSQYRVLINAQNGDEEVVEKLEKTDMERI